MHIKDHVDAHNCGVNGWVDSPGWYFLLEDLNEQLEAIDPNYTWVQIKQKFCELRVYLGTHDKVLCGCTSYKDCRMEQAIAHAAAKSMQICEYCGKGAGRPESYFGMITCEECEQDSRFSDDRMNRYYFWRDQVLNVEINVS